jgi:hypothetical protein
LTASTIRNLPTAAPLILSDAEAAVLAGLWRLPDKSLSYGTNVPLTLASGRIFRIDALVIREGRVGVIEVDGPSHRGRWAAVSLAR